MKSPTIRFCLGCVCPIAVLFLLCLAVGAGAAGVGKGSAPAGTIAYVRGGMEVHVIRPDGTGDRTLWTAPPTKSHYGSIRELAFRPDGQEVAFASNHDEARSYYASDIYGIRVDGKGLHRLTNAPSPDDLARFKKCKVALTITNAGGNAMASLLVAYVMGSPRAHMVTPGFGRGTTVVFDDVAVIPGALQPPMVAFGGRRWGGPPVHLVPGQTNRIEMTLSGPGFEMMGAYCPVWTADGKRIAYRFGDQASVWCVPADGAPGSGIGRALGGKQTHPAHAFDLGPATIPGGNLLYTPGWTADGEEDRSIYQTDEAGANRTQLLHYESGTGGSITQVRWLPDGSGFLFTRYEPLTFAEGINICRFDLATRRETPLTEFKNEAVRNFAISPDGNWVVLERGQAVYNPWDKTSPSLWLMRIDGSDMRRLAENAWSPAWGK